MKQNACKCLTSNFNASKNWYKSYFLGSTNEIGIEHAVEQAQNERWNCETNSSHSGLNLTSEFKQRQHKGVKRLMSIFSKMCLQVPERPERIVVQRIEPQLTRVKVVKGKINATGVIKLRRRQPRTSRVHYFSRDCRYTPTIEAQVSRLETVHSDINSPFGLPVSMSDDVVRSHK